MPPESAPPKPASGPALVPLSFLERTPGITTYWDAKAQLATVSRLGVTVQLRPGSKEVVVRSMPARSTRRQTLSLAPRLQEGQLYVPSREVREALGLHDPRPPARGLAAEDRPNPRATGAIAGEVRYAGRAASGVVLRLVRDADSTFVRERRSVAGADGIYRFPAVPPGRYRVYAYVGDNPDYFNRETPPVTVRDAVARATPIALGRILQPRAPRPGATLHEAESITLRWSPCPEASAYHVSVGVAGTKWQVLDTKVVSPELTLPAHSLSPGRSYLVSVSALDSDGGFLGATPGSGAAPWRFTVGE